MVDHGAGAAEYLAGGALVGERTQAGLTAEAFKAPRDGRARPPRPSPLRRSSAGTQLPTDSSQLPADSSLRPAQRADRPRRGAPSRNGPSGRRAALPRFSTRGHSADFSSTAAGDVARARAFYPVQKRSEARIDDISDVQSTLHTRSAKIRAFDKLPHCRNSAFL